MPTDKKIDWQRLLVEDRQEVIRCSVCGEEFSSDRDYRVHHVEKHQKIELE